MAYDKFLTLNYETPEQAAAMAAQINANEPGGAVRAYSKGLTLEVVPSNAAVTDIFTFFSRVGEGVAALFKRSAGTSKGGATANA